MDQALKCNHCYSDNTEKHIWGRTEYWVCKSCKKEVTTEESYNGIDWGVWNPKDYGLSIDSHLVTLQPGFEFNLSSIDTHKKGN